MAELARALPDDAKKPDVVILTEVGVSTCASGSVARRELPEHDSGLRAAVSLARRAQDPLAEFAKMDAEELAIGLHMEDAHQGKLRTRLREVMEWCIHDVGADLNTAPPSLLRHISGVTPQAAKSIVRFRDENGGFRNRAQLLTIAEMTPDAYRQCAGFLRISDGDNPLDALTIHPEAYPVVEEIARDFDLDIPGLIGNEKALNAIRLDQYSEGPVGRQTLHDILTELRTRGGDRRAKRRAVQFFPETPDAADLLKGTTVDGVVTNVVGFGAFVDIGMPADGLVHISELADGFVNDPNDVVTVGQVVKARILGVDADRGRVSLSLCTRAEPKPQDESSEAAKPRPDARPRRPSRPRRPRPSKEDTRGTGRATAANPAKPPTPPTEPPRKPEKTATMADLLSKYGDPFAKRKD